MTPTFALDLAHDGIRLLFRAEGGWTVVGDVALEDPALPARLAALRAEAERIAPGAVATEVIIPPSQIRYATIPAEGADPSEDRIRDAASGLTPLDPEDLVLDWEGDGDGVRLALLDRMTIDEAESFAEAHGFNPVSFTARPTPDQFPRPPHFGRTPRAAEAAPAPPPPPAAPADPAPARAETAPILGAEALALSLSAPPPGVDLAASGPAASSAARRRPLAIAAVAAVLLVGVGAALGLRGGFTPSLPDTPPQVTVAAPTPAAAPPAVAEASPNAAVAARDAAPVALFAEVPGLPEPGGLAPPSADVAAPPALAGRPPVVASRVPEQGRPPTPKNEGSEAIYLASIDPRTLTRDAVALPPAASLLTAPRPVTPLAPPPPGTTFDVAEDGLVRATPEGAFTPDGIRVTEGLPPLLPPAPPPRVAELELVPTETAAALPALRPRVRPVDLVERGERAALGGWTREELAGYRPAPRPLSEQARAEAAQPSAPSELAVTASLLPRDRPADLASRAATQAAVAAALAAPAPAPAPEPAPAAAPVRQQATAAPSTDDYDDGEPEVVAAAPSIPTTASVARQATINNAIRLREINLIGVYGTDRDRRALVRLANGRYQKVKVGDRLDGGQIAAIGRDDLRYTKGGRNITLTVPSG